MSRGRPIWQAYSDTNALAVPCTNCCAQQGIWCTKPDGRVSKMPCVARIAAADIAPQATAALGNTTEIPTQAFDFSEPRHHHDDRTTP